MGFSRHLTSGISLKMVGRDTWQKKWLGYACVLIFLFGTTAQAAHLCGSVFPERGAPRFASSFSSSSTNSALCLACLMAQSATALAFFMVFFPAFRSRSLLRATHTQPRAFLPTFQLYVRPPPAS